jgi:hypothetical protein
MVQGLADWWRHTPIARRASSQSPLVSLLISSTILFFSRFSYALKKTLKWE